MKALLRSAVAGACMVVAGLASTAPAQAQQPVEQRIEALARQVEELRRQLARQDTAELARLRAQIEALTREIEALRLGADVVPQADSAAYGLGPAASKVYRVRQGVSLGGYGELLYENFADEREDETPAGRLDRIDALRWIMYVGYKFTDRILFNSEIEIEHGSTDKGGSVSIEFAYLDYVASPALGVRAGVLLVPMGLVNELHEPPIFLGSTRPLTESAIIPSTWRENGAGVFGEAGDLAYRAYVVNGLDARGFGAGGLRGGRQKAANAIIENPAVVARVDYSPTNALRGLLVGGSVYRGGSGQGVGGAGEEPDVPTTIWEAHAQYKARGLDLRALYAAASLDEVAELNAVRNLAGAASVGERLTGFYVQGGYDVLRFTRTNQQLIPYLRWERLDTQAEVPAGFQRNPASERTALLIGAAWKPIPNIAVKADYQIHTNEAETGVNQFNIALGYLF